MVLYRPVRSLYKRGSTKCRRDDHMATVKGWVREGDVFMRSQTTLAIILWSQNVGTRDSGEMAQM